MTGAGPLHASKIRARAKIKQLVNAAAHCKKPYAKIRKTEIEISRVSRRQQRRLRHLLPLKDNYAVIDL